MIVLGDYWVAEGSRNSFGAQSLQFLEKYGKDSAKCTEHEVVFF